MSRVPRASWQLAPLLLQLLHLLHSGMGQSNTSQASQTSAEQSASHQATGRRFNPYHPPMHAPPPPFYGTRYHPPASLGHHPPYYPSPAPSAYPHAPPPAPTCSAAHYHSPPASAYGPPPAHPPYHPYPPPYHYGSMPGYRASSGAPAPPQTGVAAGPAQGPQMRLMTPSGLHPNMLNPFGLPATGRAADAPAPAPAPAPAAAHANAPVIVPVELTAHQAARLAEDLSHGAHVVPMGPMVSIAHAPVQRIAPDPMPVGGEAESDARAAVFHKGLGGVIGPMGFGVGSHGGVLNPLGAFGHGHHAFGLFRETGPEEAVAQAEQQEAAAEREEAAAAAEAAEAATAVAEGAEAEGAEAEEAEKARAAGSRPFGSRPFSSRPFGSRLGPPKVGVVGTAAHAGVGAGLVKAGRGLVGVGGHGLSHVGVGKGLVGASALGKVGAFGLAKRPPFGLLRAAGEGAEGAEERSYSPAYEPAPAPPAYAAPAPAPYANPAPPAAPCYADYATSYVSVPIYHLPLYATPSYSAQPYPPAATY